jgi:hypothetical protein
MDRGKGKLLKLVEAPKQETVEENLEFIKVGQFENMVTALLSSVAVNLDSMSATITPMQLDLISLGKIEWVKDISNEDEPKVQKIYKIFEKFKLVINSFNISNRQNYLFLILLSLIKRNKLSKNEENVKFTLIKLLYSKYNTVNLSIFFRKAVLDSLRKSSKTQPYLPYFKGRLKQVNPDALQYSPNNPINIDALRNFLNNVNQNGVNGHIENRMGEETSGSGILASVVLPLLKVSLRQIKGTLTIKDIIASFQNYCNDGKICDVKYCEHRTPNCEIYSAIRVIITVDGAGQADDGELNPLIGEKINIKTANRVSSDNKSVEQIIVVNFDHHDIRALHPDAESTDGKMNNVLSSVIDQIEKLNNEVSEEMIDSSQSLRTIIYDLKEKISIVDECKYVDFDTALLILFSELEMYLNMPDPDTISPISQLLMTRSVILALDLIDCKESNIDVFTQKLADKYTKIQENLSQYVDVNLVLTVMREEKIVDGLIEPKYIIDIINKKASIQEIEAKIKKILDERIPLILKRVKIKINHILQYFRDNQNIEPTIENINNIIEKNGWIDLYIKAKQVIQILDGSENLENFITETEQKLHENSQIKQDNLSEKMEKIVSATKIAVDSKQIKDIIKNNGYSSRIFDYRQIMAIISGETELDEIILKIQIKFPYTEPEKVRLQINDIIDTFSSAAKYFDTSSNSNVNPKIIKLITDQIKEASLVIQPHDSKLTRLIKILKTIFSKTHVVKNAISQIDTFSGAVIPNNLEPFLTKFITTADRNEATGIQEEPLFQLQSGSFFEGIKVARPGFSEKDWELRELSFYFLAVVDYLHGMISDFMSVYISGDSIISQQEIIPEIIKMQAMVLSMTDKNGNIHVQNFAKVLKEIGFPPLKELKSKPDYSKHYRYASNSGDWLAFYDVTIQPKDTEIGHIRTSINILNALHPPKMVVAYVGKTQGLIGQHNYTIITNFIDEIPNIVEFTEFVSKVAGFICGHDGAKIENFMGPGGGVRGCRYVGLPLGPDAMVELVGWYHKLVKQKPAEAEFQSQDMLATLKCDIYRVNEKEFFDWCLTLQSKLFERMVRQSLQKA